MIFTDGTLGWDSARDKYRVPLSPAFAILDCVHEYDEITIPPYFPENIRRMLPNINIKCYWDSTSDTDNNDI